MPQYMLLIYQPADIQMTPEQFAEMGPRWDSFTESLHKAGAFVAGDALERPDVATTVRVRGRRDAVHGRAVRRDQGVPGRLLPGRLPRSRHRARVRLAHAERRHIGSTEVRPVWDRTGPQATSREQVAQA